MPKITVNIFFPRVRLWPKRKPRVYDVYMVAQGVWDAYEVVAVYEERRMARQMARECNEANVRVGGTTGYAWVEEISFHLAGTSA